MRAVVVEKLGGPEVLRVVEQPAPEPQHGQLIVQVAAVGVNYMDIYTREGVGGYKPAQFPVVPGAEGAGTVTAVGAGVTEFSPGDRVAWAGVPHSYAEQAAVPAARAVPVPPGVDLQVAAAVILQGLTAHYLCFSTYPVRERDVAVVHAAAGGVGLLLTQLVKQRGGIVVATTSGCAGLGMLHGHSVWIGDRPEAFAAGIATLLADGARRGQMAQAAYLHAVRHFDWRAIGEKQRELLRSMLPRR